MQSLRDVNVYLFVTGTCILKTYETKTCVHIIVSTQGSTFQCSMFIIVKQMTINLIWDGRTENIISLSLI